MRRLLFSKDGRAVYISHLDLMRVFQRSFRRAGLMLKHTQGFTPHAMVSIALPLSVGVSSQCELLDFELAEGSEVPDEEIVDRLNDALPQGLEVLKVYSGGRKIKELVYLQGKITLEYDHGAPKNAATQIEDLFKKEQLFVEKKGKSGVVEVDILPMIQKLYATEIDQNTVELTCVICAQNPALNPALIVSGLKRYGQALAPDFARIHRVNILCADGTPFR